MNIIELRLNIWQLAKGGFSPDIPEINAWQRRMMPVLILQLYNVEGYFGNAQYNLC